MQGLPKPLDFSLVLACYCEVPHLQGNVRALEKYLSSTTFSYEIIFVEDASPDSTLAEVLKSADFLRSRGIPHTVLGHTRNCGRGRTVQDGFRVAQGEIVGYIDIDLEHPMDALLPMLLRLKSGEVDALVAHRVSYKKLINPIRTWLSNGYRALVHSVLDLPVSDTEAGLKLFNRQKLLPVLDFIEDEAWFWDTEIVHKASMHGLKFSEHTIVFKRNISKKSTVRVVRDTFVYLKTLSSYLIAQRRRTFVNQEISVALKSFQIEQAKQPAAKLIP